MEETKKLNDTGTTVNVIGLRKSRHILGSEPKHEPTDLKFKCFEGLIVERIGHTTVKCEVKCQRKKVKFDLIFQVVQMQYCTLLSAST